jgi:hypothetical protein
MITVRTSIFLNFLIPYFVLNLQELLVIQITNKNNDFCKIITIINQSIFMPFYEYTKYLHFSYRKFV